MKTVAGEAVEVLGLDPDCPGWVFVRFVGLGHEARVQTAWLKEDEVDSREKGIAAKNGVKAKRAAKPKPTVKVAASKKAAPKKAAWKDLPDVELAEHLRAHVTLGDAQWKDRARGQVRQDGEKRDSFIRRALLREEA